MIQLYVKAPSGSAYTTPEAMKRVRDHIRLFGASFAPSKTGIGLPVQEQDGSWEIRVYQKRHLDLVKFILKDHYGLTIVREEAHD